MTWTCYLRKQHPMYLQLLNHVWIVTSLMDKCVLRTIHVCYRKDRNRNGGGCAVFVKSKWPSKRRKDLESESLEMVCVEICP